MTLYTSLSPCMMCTGTILQFGIPRVVIGEAQNFAGNPDFLRQHGVEVLVADDADCVALMRRFIAERSEEHTSELQSLMRNSYAVFCLKKQIKTTNLGKIVQNQRGNRP